MLQKILVVLLGLVVSLVGALSPEGLFASSPLPGAVPAADAVDAPLATVRLDDGKAFARVSVLWVEADGRRVAEDAWGTGTIDELRFKVGVKDVEGLALAVGDRLVPLSPTDVVTVRTFAGEFAVRDAGSPKATLQLSGTIKTALLKPGEAGTRVRTETGETSGAGAGADASPGGLAYVVLTTGERVETARVEDGGARLFTEEAPAARDATSQAGNLLAKWVRIDGKAVSEYTWGDGPVGSVEFEPADAGKGGGVLAFDGAASDVPSGARVLVKDFVGEYLVYQVAGGLVRLRLDGYAGDYVVGQPVSPSVQAGEGAPIAAFEYDPPSPKTTDTIRFTDRSTDDTAVVFRQWRFGDANESVLPNPTHRFRAPGAYTVTLTVTDTDRQTSQTSAVIEVRNAEPVPDFDFWPLIVTTDTLVTFTDASEDTDGRIVNWTWDFGDGARSHERHATHRFSASGDATVRLTVVDELGGSASVTKVVPVRNTPPLARFNYSPNDVSTLVPVQFQDDSLDRDGSIVSRRWNFGDGTTGSGLSPTHAYPRPGVYTVSLTVTDNAGDSDTASTTILVKNRLPLVNFSWTPVGATSDTPVQFTSLATDLDGTVVLHQWDFGDGSIVPNSDSVTSHKFPRAGRYNVTLTVTDNSLQTNSTTVEIGIANAIPRAQIGVTPNPVFRGVEATFADLSTDPDGDPIVNRTWRFGPGEPEQHDQVVRRTYASTGTYPVTLVVRDAAGSTASTTTQVRVVNRPPIVSGVSSWPPFPLVDQPVYFNASGGDLDAQPGDPEIVYEWRFSDGVTLHGKEVVRTFSTPGRVSGSVRLRDFENATSNPASTAVEVQLALPVAAFTWSPAIPATGDVVRFQSLSTSLNGPITSHVWEFKDGTTDLGETVDHVFGTGGTRLVKLTVTDNRSRSGSIELPVHVNERPVADFVVDRQGVVPLGVPVRFSDQSTDSDGRIVHWQWDFGDGSSNEASPTHEFSTPGPREVNLTVTDDQGGTDTVTRLVTVENRRPVARWSASGAFLVGQPVSFASAAFDPDGTPIADHEWSFGDGESSRAPSPVHVYAQSGRYTVNLIVRDGELASRTEPGSYQTIRIGADHPVEINFRGVLPDGTAADLSSGDYVVAARVGQVVSGFTPLEGSRLLANGTGLVARLGEGDWVRGDVVVARLSAPRFFPETLESHWILAEHDGVVRRVEVVFEIPMPLDASIAASPGTRSVLPDVPLLAPNHDTTPEGDPVYRDPTEPFRGYGRVLYADGRAASGVSVVVEARWVGARSLAAPREAAGLDGSSLLGWCAAATATTDATGAYVWAFDSRSQCAFHDAGVSPAGRWEIRAKATSPTFARPDTSDVRAVYVDPTGGLLWSAAAPP